jgi:putative transposase
MIRLTLTDPEHAAVQALRRDPTLRPAERDRVEMVLLAATGWSPPRIATHLRCHAKTVRLVLVRFREEGPPSLRRRRPGPPPDVARRAQVEAALDRLLDQDRTWTAAQLAAALAEDGIQLSPRQTRKYLGRIAAWRRTVHTLRHKQDPAKVERATAVLCSLKKRPPPAASGSSISTNAVSPPANP